MNGSDCKHAAVADDAPTCSICFDSGSVDAPLYQFCHCSSKWSHAACLQTWMRSRFESGVWRPSAYPFARAEWSGTVSQPVQHFHSFALVQLTLLTWLQWNRSSPQSRIYFAADERPDNAPAPKPHCPTCRNLYTTMRRDDADVTSIDAATVVVPANSAAIARYIAHDCGWRAMPALVFFVLYGITGAHLLAACCATFAWTFGTSLRMRLLGCGDENESFNTPLSNPNHARDLQKCEPLPECAALTSDCMRIVRNFLMPPASEIATTQYHDRYAGHYCREVSVQYADHLTQHNADAPHHTSTDEPAAAPPPPPPPTRQSLQITSMVLFLLIFLVSHSMVEFAVGGDLMQWLFLLYCCRVCGGTLHAAAQHALYNWVRLVVVPVHYAQPPPITSRCVVVALQK